MKLEEQQIADLGITPEVAVKIEELTNDHEANLKKEWDGKANTDAERILQGAADKVEQLTGIKREQGQKIADYIDLAGTSYAKGSKESYESKKIELENKLKEAKADPLLKEQIEDLKGQLDVLKQKEAQFADWEENDYKGKYEQSVNELTLLRESQAFASIKPVFPETVNKYEANFKWNDFVKRTKDNYEIKEVEGEFKAINKDNPHKVVSLESLYKKETELVELTKGRQQTGLGSGTKKDIDIEGVPFKVPENATPQERQKAIKDYLIQELGSHLHKDYSKKFEEYNNKLRGKTTA